MSAGRGGAPDRITLSGVRGRGFHGVFEHERREGQEFVVDVELAVDLGAAGRTDDLADTVNYGEIGAAVLARIEGEPYDLIERLAAVIAEDALSHTQVDEAAVTVHKPQAPVGVPFGDVTVQVVRRRDPLPVVIALGANLVRGEDTPEDTLEAALAELGRLEGLTGLRVSAFFDTTPVGGPPDQPDYVNAVAVARTTLSPASVLRSLHAVEAGFDRTREVRWGPRTLDLDLVQLGDPSAGTDVVSARPHLTLPHPRAHQRGFVLVPWLDVDPGAVLRLGDGATPVADLVDAVDTAGVRRRPTTPDAVPSVSSVSSGAFVPTESGGDA